MKSAVGSDGEANCRVKYTVLSFIIMFHNLRNTISTRNMF